MWGMSAPTSERIGSLFPVADPADPPEEVRGLFVKATEKLGFVPNVLRAWAFRPERLRLWWAHYGAMREPTENLDQADRELIAVVVSSVNRCLYCLSSHGAALREALGDPVQGERIAYDWRRSGLDARRTAIAAYAEKLTVNPVDVGHADLQSLLEVGLSLEEAWDVAEIASMYNFTNRMAMATGMLPNEEYSGMARPPAPQG